MEGHLNGQVVGGSYKFMGHLHALDSCRPELTTSYGVNPPWDQINTPLMLEEWKVALEDHPDQEFTEYITKGIQEGFRLGVPEASCRTV